MKNFLILSDAAGSLLNHLTTQFNFELGGDKKNVSLKTWLYNCFSILTLKNDDPSTEFRDCNYGEDVFMCNVDLLKRSLALQIPKNYYEIKYL